MDIITVTLKMGVALRLLLQLGNIMPQHSDSDFDIDTGLSYHNITELNFWSKRR